MMKEILIYFLYIIPFAFSIYEEEFNGRRSWEGSPRRERLMKNPDWNKYHPTTESRNSSPKGRADEYAARWSKKSYIDHWNDHSHDHNHTHKHLQEHEHDHNQTHLHVEEHDHTHEHAHTHKHNHLHDQSHNHTHDQGHEHDHKHKHKHSEDHSHDHHEYYSKRRRLSGGDAYDEVSSKYNDYDEHPNHQYNRNQEPSYESYYNEFNKDNIPNRKYYPKERPNHKSKYQSDQPHYHPTKEAKYPEYLPEYQYEKPIEKDTYPRDEPHYHPKRKPTEESKYPEYLPQYHPENPVEKDKYPIDEPHYHSKRRPERQPSLSENSLKDYHMKSVENYIGDSGKEFEGAAEKIVEGYMGEYMDKYMNEWYIKYCTDTGKYCDQVKVIKNNKDAQESSSASNQQSYQKKPNQYYPTESPMTKNQFKTGQKYVKSNQFSPEYNYEKPAASIHYEKYPSSEIQDMIEKDKYVHNNLKHQNQFSPTKPSGPIHETRFPPVKNLPPTYNQGYVQRPRRNQSKPRKEKKRRGRKQIRKRKPQPTVFHAKKDPYRDFDSIEDMFAGNMFDGAPMYDQPYNKYNGYSEIEETDIDTIDRSYQPRY